MIMWQHVTETTQFVEILGERVPVSVEGMMYLSCKYKALEMDYNNLVDEIHQLEHQLKHQEETLDNYWSGNPQILLDPY